MIDTTRAAGLAREYDALQGLTFVVLGGAFLFGSLVDEPAVWIALGAAASASAPLWYQRRFGTVKPTPDRNAWVALGVATALLLFLGAYVADRHLRGPVLLTLLAVALSLGVGQHLMLRRTGLTPVHLAVYGLVALAAAGPLVGLGTGAQLLPYVLAVTGGALVVVGLVDHRRLVRALAPVEDEDHDGGC
jgi:hypothetical protein